MDAKCNKEQVYIVNDQFSPKFHSSLRRVNLKKRTSTQMYHYRSRSTDVEQSQKDLIDCLQKKISELTCKLKTTTESNRLLQDQLQEIQIMHAAQINDVIEQNIQSEQSCTKWKKMYHDLQKENQQLKDELDCEDTDSDESTTVSSTWPCVNNVFKQKSNNTYKLFKTLDEFILDKQDIETFNKCEKLHNDMLGVNGMKFVDNLVKNNIIIGSDCIDDFMIEEWQKNDLIKEKTK